MTWYGREVLSADQIQMVTDALMERGYEMVAFQESPEGDWVVAYAPGRIGEQGEYSFSVRGLTAESLLVAVALLPPALPSLRAPLRSATLALMAERRETARLRAREVGLLHDRDALTRRIHGLLREFMMPADRAQETADGE